MPEDDFLIPRRGRSSAPEAETDPGPNATARGVSIDPKILEERRRRKETLAPQIKTVDSEKDEPWRYLDRRIGEAFSAFKEPMWTLGDAARWVAERTREAVDGLSIDEERLPEIVPEIHGALAAGDVRSRAHTPNDPVPHELPAETWAVYHLAVEECNGLLFIVPFRPSGSPDDEAVLLDLRLSREDILHRWPNAQGKTPSREVGTVGAEFRCRLWLTELMKADPDKPRPKEGLRKEAKSRFPKLGNRGFDRAWAAAVAQSGADRWSAPGRRF
jgi:hypothetical protein